MKTQEAQDIGIGIIAGTVVTFILTFVISFIAPSIGGIVAGIIVNKDAKYGVIAGIGSGIIIGGIAVGLAKAHPLISSLEIVIGYAALSGIGGFLGGEYAAYSKEKRSVPQKK